MGEYLTVNDYRTTRIGNPSICQIVKVSSNGMHWRWTKASTGLPKIYIDNPIVRMENSDRICFLSVEISILTVTWYIFYFVFWSTKNTFIRASWPTRRTFGVTSRCDMIFLSPILAAGGIIMCWACTFGIEYNQVINTIPTIIDIVM